MNATDSSAFVTLSHTRPLAARGAFIPEENAMISIKSSNGQYVELLEQDSGRYTQQKMDIDFDATYTMTIKTESGATYTSEAVAVRRTPPIDSLSYGFSNDNLGLSIRLNTHDDTGNSRYYAWEYAETFEYKSYYNSNFKFQNNQPSQRRADERIDKCYVTIPSSRILLGSSATLEQDVIQGEELVIIPKYSPKISLRYSLLIKQRTLSLQEYEYLYQLRQVTERLGTFFDPLPGEVIGNVKRNEDTTELVLGYFSAAEVFEKRYFIEKEELPIDLQASPIIKGCQVEFSCDIRLPRGTPQRACVYLEDISDNAVLVEAAYDQMGNPIRYSFTTAECGDCRAQGGITTRPDFW